VGAILKQRETIHNGAVFFFHKCLSDLITS